MYRARAYYAYINRSSEWALMEDRCLTRLIPCLPLAYFERSQKVYICLPSTLIQHHSSAEDLQCSPLLNSKQFCSDFA